ncbi:hypothetical protein ALC57_09922, partial [Trachymyrmex cornetzi]
VIKAVTSIIIVLGQRAMIVTGIRESSVVVAWIRPAKRGACSTNSHEEVPETVKWSQCMRLSKDIRRRRRRRRRSRRGRSDDGGGGRGTIQEKRKTKWKRRDPDKSPTRHLQLREVLARLSCRNPSISIITTIISTTTRWRDSEKGIIYKKSYKNRVS